jgi:DNA mismatch repair protein MutS2
MKPLFRLETGKPGSSFAIDIARQIGLPEEILKTAALKAGEEHVNIDRHLREILRDKRYWENKRENIRISEKKLSGIVGQYEKELMQIKQLRKEIVDKAKSEADELLSVANREIEKTIRLIKESQADKEITRSARAKLQDIGTGSELPAEDGKLNDTIEKVQRLSTKYGKGNAKPEISENPDEKELKPGDTVKISGTDSTGEILEIMDDTMLITFGESMITTVKKSAVEPADQKSGKKRTRSVAGDWSLRKLDFKPEIDVRGKRGNEAIETVKHFIDDATIVGAPELRILHGKGNGTLRQMIREYLAGLDIVGSFSDEHVERGGTGITVVRLDF